jgi:hypothetical protein
MCITIVDNFRPGRGCHSCFGLVPCGCRAGCRPTSRSCRAPSGVRAVRGDFEGRNRLCAAWKRCFRVEVPPDESEMKQRRTAASPAGAERQRSPAGFKGRVQREGSKAGFKGRAPRQGSPAGGGRWGNPRRRGTTAAARSGGGLG